MLHSQKSALQLIRQSALHKFKTSVFFQKAINRNCVDLTALELNAKIRNSLLGAPAPISEVQNNKYYCFSGEIVTYSQHNITTAFSLIADTLRGIHPDLQLIMPQVRDPIYKSIINRTSVINYDPLLPASSWHKCINDLIGKTPRILYVSNPNMAGELMKIHHHTTLKNFAQNPNHWIFIDESMIFSNQFSDYDNKILNLHPSQRIIWGFCLEHRVAPNLGAFILSHNHDLMLQLREKLVDPKANCLNDPHQIIFSNCYLFTKLHLLHKIAWIKLSDQFPTLIPRIPESGYITMIPKSYKDLAKNGILAIPGNVFGASNNVSVISCLNEVNNLCENSENFHIATCKTSDFTKTFNQPMMSSMPINTYIKNHADELSTHTNQALSLIIGKIQSEIKDNQSKFEPMKFMSYTNDVFTHSSFEAEYQKACAMSESEFFDWKFLLPHELIILLDAKPHNIKHYLNQIDISKRCLTIIDDPKYDFNKLIKLIEMLRDVSTVTLQANYCRYVYALVDHDDNDVIHEIFVYNFIAGIKSAGLHTLKVKIDAGKLILFKDKYLAQECSNAHLNMEWCIDLNENVDLDNILTSTLVSIAETKCYNIRLNPSKQAQKSTLTILQNLGFENKEVDKFQGKINGTDISIIINPSRDYYECRIKGMCDRWIIGENNCSVEIGDLKYSVNI